VTSLHEKNLLSIALIGFMGSGKTSIGKILASRLALPLFDLDAEIEAARGATIAEIFSRHGEAFFRTLEEKSLAILAGKGIPLVLSCGGGVVLSPVNREVLRRDFATVWLDVPLSELKKRLAGEREKRPLLSSDDYESRIEKLFLSRQSLYEATARFTVRWADGEEAEASALRIIETLGIGEF